MPPSGLDLQLEEGTEGSPLLPGLGSPGLCPRCSAAALWD